MITIGDFAQNRKTGKLGKVIGYGHQILNGVYQTTLKVLIVDAAGDVDHVEEDLISAWEKLEDDSLIEPDESAKSEAA